MSGPDPEGGWERRFVVASERAGELVLLYERLGYEVRTGPVSAPPTPAACGDCAARLCLTCVEILTRKRPA